ncbi:MAG: hypothetical protein RSF83_10975 [Hungatella sp.]
MADKIELNDESIQNLSYVLGQNYQRARFVGNETNSSREIGLLTKEYGEISQFHQGAGEDTILDMFKLLQTIPQQSLLVIDDELLTELFAFLEDTEAVSLFWEILKSDTEHYEEFCKKISCRAVGSCSVVGTLFDLAKSNKLPYSSLAIIDGDKKSEYPDCLSLPGDLAPEKQVLTDLKSINWNNLDERFGIGVGTLFKYLDDALLLPDHHKWTEYIGDNVKKARMLFGQY